MGIALYSGFLLLCSIALERIPLFAIRYAFQFRQAVQASREGLDLSTQSVY